MREDDLLRRIGALFADDARPDPEGSRRERVKAQVDFRLGLLAGLGLGPIGAPGGDDAGRLPAGEARPAPRRRTG